MVYGKSTVALIAMKILIYQNKMKLWKTVKY